MTKIDSALNGATLREPLDRVSKAKPNPQNEQVKSKQIDQAGFSELLTGRIAKDSKTGTEAGVKVAEANVQSGGLKFSAHAQNRLSSRGIELSAEDLVKMQEAILKAHKKGSKESLLVTDKAAFVVSVKNNTVITAVDRDSLKENVFTNIDSTILI